MSKYVNEMTVNGKTLEKINFYLHDANEGEYLHEDETITFTAVFPDGMEMDVKCCGVQGGDDYCAWTEAVLFKNGAEVACSEVSDELEGVWSLEYDGAEYTVIVKREPEE